MNLVLINVYIDENSTNTKPIYININQLQSIAKIENPVLKEPLYYVCVGNSNERITKADFDKLLSLGGIV